MSLPTDAEVMAALASLAGEEAPDREADELAVAMTRLRFIASAQQAGATWEMIARATGLPNAKAAKRHTKLLARRTQREMLASRPLVEEDA